MMGKMEGSSDCCFLCLYDCRKGAFSLCDKSLAREDLEFSIENFSTVE